MAVKHVAVQTGQLRDYALDYDRELIALRFTGGQIATLTFAEARGLRHDWTILLTRAVVARHRAERGGRIVEVLRLGERGER